MSDSKTLIALALAGLALVPGVARGQAAPAPAETAPLGEGAVVERAVQKNPSLHVALLQAERAAADLRAEEGLYSPVWRANAAFTRSRSPSIYDGEVDGTDVFDVGTSLEKPFPWGTVVSLGVFGRRSVRADDTGTAIDVSPNGTDTPAIVSAFESQPGHLVGANLTLTQPFLRGAGDDVGLATLRAARLERTAAALAAEESASVLLRDVLRAYWELWYAEQVVRINDASRELTREQDRQAREQVASGALARIDALVYTTRLAELEEAVVLAATERRQRSLNLGLLVGQPEPAPGLEFRAGDAPPERAAAAAESARTVDEALAASPELRRLETQIALARDRATIAGDPLRPRLDLQASVEVQGGNREVPPALEQAGRFEAVSAQVGLTFELPVDDTRRRAQVESARLGEHIARKSVEVVRQRIASDVVSALATRAAADQRVRVASDTVRVAGEQVEAERRRFSAGISIALQVQQAEDSFRQAQLRLERARVDAVEAEIELLHLRGRLLARHAGAVRRLPPGAPNLSLLPRSDL